MNCPQCKEPKLVMSERQGIEIDYCPECRGVWLDRGELDKLLERAVQEAAVPQPVLAGTRDRHYDDGREHGRHGHRRKNFLAELFD